MAFDTEKNPSVILSITLSKEIKQHKGTSKNFESRNTTVGGMVSVTVTEAAPGSLSASELYEEADKLLSNAVQVQLEENTYLMDNMS